MEQVTVLLSILALLSIFTTPVVCGVCSATCNCSMEMVPLLSESRELFILDCTSEARDVSNASIADYFIYTQPDPFAVFDSNIFYGGFNNLKGLQIIGGIQGVAFIPPIISLRLLDVSSITLHYLASYSLASISSGLLSVSLTRNQMEFLSEDSLNGVNNLLFLNLSHNHIETPPVAVFSKLINLKTLDLSHNYLTSVSSELVSELRSLTWLSVSSNRIHNIDFISFPNSAIQFYATQNPIDNITWYAQREAKLDTLDISGNLIKVLSSVSFKGAIIEKLIMSDCKHLSAVYSGVIAESAIKSIDMSSNPKLQFVDSTAFSNVVGLREVDLSNSGLSVVSQGWTNHSTIERLYVRGNPLLCDCNLFWLEGSVTVDVDILPLSDLCGADSAPVPRHCPPTIIYKSAHLTTVDEGSSAVIRCKVCTYTSVSHKIYNCL